MIPGETIKKLDKSDMLGAISEFPQQLLEGWDIGLNSSYSMKLADINSIVFSGMGGSAIAGDLVKEIIDIPVPFVVNRSYTIPEFINAKTLFIASSYSGNTEETTTALNRALEKKCNILCITSGGAIESIAKHNDLFVYKIKKGYQPRAALGYSLGIVIAFLKYIGCKTIQEKDIEDTVNLLNDKIKIWKNFSRNKNLPREIAGRIKGKVPLIYGSVGTSSSVALRWKTQLNENSKTHTFAQSFSEMNHNEIVGWEVLAETSDFFSNLCAVFLRTNDDFSRNLYRMEITKPLISASGADIIDIDAEGVSLFSRLMYLIALGDFVSFYLAILYGVDPTEIKKINLLKQQLNYGKEL